MHCGRAERTPFCKQPPVDSEHPFTHPFLLLPAPNTPSHIAPPSFYPLLTCRRTAGRRVEVGVHGPQASQRPQAGAQRRDSVDAALVGQLVEAAQLEDRAEAGVQAQRLPQRLPGRVSRCRGSVGAGVGGRGRGGTQSQLVD